MVVLTIYMLLGLALVVVKVVAKPLLLLQKKPPPEADKSPGPPKLAIKTYMLGIMVTSGRIACNQESWVTRYPPFWAYPGYTLSAPETSGPGQAQGRVACNWARLVTAGSV